MTLFPIHVDITITKQICIIISAQPGIGIANVCAPRQMRNRSGSAYHAVIFDVERCILIMTSTAILLAQMCITLAPLASMETLCPKLIQSSITRSVTNRPFHFANMKGDCKLSAFN
ncbi:hypothetical protein Trydic_g11035 [Trypoxylus dichotomus]